MRAERQGLDHVGAAADAAVEHHGHAVRLGGDLRQRAQAGERVVELAAAMVGDHHAVDAALARDARVRGRDQALDHELALPALADQLDMLPGELVARADIAHQVLRQHRRARFGVHVLEMRHAVIVHGARPGAEQPMRMGDDVPGHPRRDRHRHLKTVADVVLAVRRHRHVGGHHKGVVAGGGDAIDQRLDPLGHAGEIGLVPGVADFRAARPRA